MHLQPIAESEPMSILFLIFIFLGGFCVVLTSFIVSFKKDIGSFDLKVVVSIAAAIQIFLVGPNLPSSLFLMDTVLLFVSTLISTYLLYGGFRLLRLKKLTNLYNQNSISLIVIASYLIFLGLFWSNHQSGKVEIRVQKQPLFACHKDFKYGHITSCEIDLDPFFPWPFDRRQERAMTESECARFAKEKPFIELRYQMGRWRIPVLLESKIL